jgi:hypothetical protein
MRQFGLPVQYGVRGEFLAPGHEPHQKPEVLPRSYARFPSLKPSRKIDPGFALDPRGKEEKYQGFNVLANRKPRKTSRLTEVPPPPRVAARRACGPLIQEPPRRPLIDGSPPWSHADSFFGASL